MKPSKNQMQINSSNIKLLIPFPFNRMTTVLNNSILHMFLNASSMKLRSEYIFDSVPFRCLYQKQWKCMNFNFEQDRLLFTTLILNLICFRSNWDRWWIWPIPHNTASGHVIISKVSRQNCNKHNSGDQIITFITTF